MKISFGIRTWVKNTFSRPNRNAIFIFGFQKSGTSAIAGLLAAKTGKSVTIDTKYLWAPYSTDIKSGKLNLEHHVNQYSYPFSKAIIKEPATTFFIPQLKTYFKLDKYVFIVRNPFDNIRSILNRLNLPGDKEKILLKDVNKNWRYLFKETLGKDYISVLAKRWVLANDQKDIIKSDNCILVRYEDFNVDKDNYIRNLADRLQLPAKNNIEKILNKPFQPKGKPGTHIESFFGKTNYSQINEICNDLMIEFGY